MKNQNKKSDLLELPNIGPRSLYHLEKIGVKTISDLQKFGPEKVYDMLCQKQKTYVHMAFLYVLRAAHSYNNEKIDWGGALRWWMFRSPKDKDIVLYYKEKFKSNKKSLSRKISSKK